MSSIGTDAVLIFKTFGCSLEDRASIGIIKQRFSTYFTPKTNITYERYQFNRMSQEEGETFDEFLTKIKAQSAKCEFGTLHDSLLRDKIIIGIRSDTVREQLLADAESTLDRVTQKCRASEQASKQLRGLKSDASVQAITKHQNQQRKVSRAGSSHSTDTFDCRRCGRQHGPKSCPAFNKPCKKCDKKGHFAEMCRATGESKQKTTNSSKIAKKVHTVDEEQTSDEEFYINSIEQQRPTATNLDDDRNWYEQIKIEQVNVKVKLDSGAQCNVVSKDLATKIGARVKESRTKRIITYGGEQINVTGEIARTLVRGEQFNVKFIVVDKQVSPVLGKTSCEYTGLILRVKEININQQVFDGLGLSKKFRIRHRFYRQPNV